MRAVLRFWMIAIALGLVTSVCVGIYAVDYFSGPGPLNESKTIIFEPGKGFQSIADELAAQGVIDNPMLFKGIVAVLGEARNFKAGEYQFSANQSPKSVAIQIAGGKVLQHKLTIPEGLTVREIAALLQAEAALEGDVPAGLADGTLLPQTYMFSRGFKRADMVAQMQKGMRNTLEAAWAGRREGLPYDTPEKALVMASIVEKETGIAAERGQVASVFVNRLRKGMRLQSDPTVVYGMEQATGRPLGRTLTTIDLHAETPFNTYVIDALPPGPICNPGKASIEAVMNPPDTEDLYFVATGKGGHNFASTLEQHNRNVQLYRARVAH
jgi:UPF0755 protein